MKKFINQVELVEDQMIQGMVKAYPQYVRKLDCGNVVVRTEKKEGKVALIVGGPDGLDPALKATAHETMRLSSLTLPHAMVRVMLAEATDWRTVFAVAFSPDGTKIISGSADGRERAAQVPRRGAAFGRRIPETHAREERRRGAGFETHLARRERRLFGR